MELPPRGASYAPVIKCSVCGQDVPMDLMTDHACGSVTGTTMYAEPQSLTPSSTSIINPQPILGRPSRPFVPRIDPFASNRHMQLGELTPASSQDSFAASPVSAGSGRQSPFRMPPRKASTPAIRRPPSPELMSQDCAFPPFPSTAKAKAKELSRNESRRGRTRTPDDSNSVRSFEHDAKRSASTGTSRPRMRQGTMDSSRPSTATSSRRPSISSTTDSHKNSLNTVPPIPPLQQTSSNLSTASDPGHSQIDSSGTWPLPPDVMVTANEPEIDRLDYSEHSNTAGPGQESAISAVPNPTSQSSFPPRMDSHNGPSSTLLQDETKEPTYKAKRPPPIVSPMPYATDNQVPTLKSRSPTMPTPPTPGSAIGRTLTGLFGRRRGQSTSAKRTQPQVPDVDSPRYKALALEPEPTFPPHHHIQNNELDRGPNTDGLPSQEPLQDANPYINNGEGDIIPPTAIMQAGATQPSHQHLMGISRELDKTIVTITETPAIIATEQSAELRRASMDSASSYGSIGFSHSSASSRSTNPSELYLRASSNPGEPLPQEVDLPHSTLALRIQDTVPDSPTDPLYQPGKLTPVPEIERSVESSPDEATASNLTTYNEGAKFDFPPPPHSARLRRPSTPGASRGICRGCAKMIASGQKSVSSKDGRLTGRYHKECFVCRTCKSPFATADFYVHDDHPYCAHHYHVVNNTLCASCGKGIEGEYMETSNISGTGSKKFHQHCLKCATCKVVLQTDYFELSGRVYCEKDAFKMAHGGPRSPYDTAPSRPSPLNREYINSSEPGKAVAAGRFPERRTTRLMMTY